MGRNGPALTLLSACLIVRDEERDLPRCLAALAPVADEIVVHDTGSTDRTREIASAAGATVIDGTWTDDFAAARNVALAACTGEWILHVDADEMLEVREGDAETVHHWLTALPPDVDAVLVDIENLMDDGTGSSYSHRANRLFRRVRGRWEGRIHEQVVGPKRFGTGPPLRIVHHGYLSAAMAEKNKVNRNLALVRTALDDPSTAADQRAVLLLDLGRSLKAAGDLTHAAAVLADAYAASAAGGVGGEPIARAALQFHISCLLGLGRLHDARSAIDDLRRLSTGAAMPDFLEGQLMLQEDQPAKALALFDGIDDLVDDEGLRPGPGVLPVNRATALSLLGRWDEAADELGSAVTVHKAVRGNVEALTETFLHAGRSLDDLAKALAPVASEDIYAAALLVALEDERGDQAVRNASAAVDT